MLVFDEQFKIIKSLNKFWERLFPLEGNVENHSPVLQE